MSYTPGFICDECNRHRDEHCQTCWSCQGEPVSECCMEGWSDETKEYERKHWLTRSKRAELEKGKMD